VTRRAFAELETEGVHPASADLDLLPTVEIVRRVAEESEAAVRAVRAAVPAIARLADSAAESFRRGGRIVLAGAGTSGRLAMLDAVELTPTFGWPRERAPVLLAGGERAMFRSEEGAEDRADDGARGVRDVGAGRGDLVVGVTASGRTPFVRGALEEAARRGTATGLVTCNDPPAEVRADVVVLLRTGPELLAGSTRMNAGTATKIALNALSLAAMVRIGKVHGNRMVDLRIGSAKLRDRAVRLVEEFGRTDRGRAEAALRAAGGHAKTAVLMVRRHLSAGEARRLLAASDDSLRRALGEAPR
jgi:N-acetylmuramic acid 6-phosphate etherase